MYPVESDILSLIPQRPPMVMISRLVFADDNTARGELDIEPANLFCENGLFRETGMVECIAQTAAAYLGLKNRLSNQPVKEGYIGAVKNLEVFALAAAGTTVTSEIRVDNEIVGYTIITGSVMQGEHLLARCEMRILEKQ